MRKPVLSVALSLAVAGAAAAPAQTVDHSLFDGLLRRHVTEGLVDYGAFARAPELARYLDLLDRVRPDTLPRDEQLAYWINLYNAATIHLVNKHGERESIRNINKSFGLLRLKGPWRERFVRAGGALYTLDDVEHGIIRKRFAEPRIHFALVCAAMGCPPLRAEAYTGEALDDQLEDQAELFLLRTPQKNRVDPAGGKVYVSQIFRWFSEDFGGSREAIGRYIAGFYPEGPEKQRLLSGDFDLIETDYDWTLNRQEKAPSRR
ncbi:MAG TPA: DUF547 domain-containing protein [Vicinamibacteria bacterium]|nr:DUF547 domain-containing protein [Vicinamibacteria bacterium]